MKENNQNRQSLTVTDVPGDISENDQVLILGKPGKSALTVNDKVAVFSDRQVALNVRGLYVFAGTNVVLSLPLNEVKSLYKSDLVYVTSGDQASGSSIDALGTQYER